MNAQRIGSLALKSLLLEIETWPKPGLVSLIDNGSHLDMNAALLRDSAFTLRPYFAQLAQAGAERRPLSELQRIGRVAEVAMLKATHGVNTHRGAIFGMGLLCAAAGMQSAGAASTVSLGSIVRHTWGASIDAAMPAIGAPDALATHGAKMLSQYGARGARAEAVSGFERIYQVGWPALQHARQLSGGDESAARVQCCFALIAAVIDTNLLYRGGAAGLKFARDASSRFIQRGGVGCADWREWAVGIHRAFVARRLSPGGSADLLAMTSFVDAWHTRSDPPARAQTSEQAQIA